MKTLTLMLCLMFVSCATLKADPLVVTGESLDLVEQSVKTTRNGLADAAARGAISQAVVDGWNKDFYPRYKISYHVAVDTWRAAKRTGNTDQQKEAAAIISTILSDLTRYSSLVLLAPTAAPDGGTP